MKIRNPSQSISGISIRYLSVTIHYFKIEVLDWDIEWKFLALSKPISSFKLAALLATRNSSPYTILRNYA